MRNARAPEGGFFLTHTVHRPLKTKSDNNVVYLLTYLFTRWSYLSEVDSRVLTGAQAKCRNVQTGQVDAFERNLLAHSVHHQFTVQRET